MNFHPQKKIEIARIIMKIYFIFNSIQFDDGNPLNNECCLRKDLENLSKRRKMAELNLGY